MLYLIELVIDFASVDADTQQGPQRIPGNLLWGKVGPILQAMK